MRFQFAQITAPESSSNRVNPLVARSSRSRFLLQSAHILLMRMYRFMSGMEMSNTYPAKRKEAAPSTLNIVNPGLFMTASLVATNGSMSVRRQR